jgi:peptidoglycan hydrolase-like protein with peptidoglycan-binding domain
MKKIIRVTESELVKLIGKVINEQAAYTPTDAGYSPYYNFRTGQMAGTAAPAPAPGPAMSPFGDPTQFTQQASPNIGCVGFKSSETNKTIKGFNGEIFKFFNNGRFIDAKGQKGNYVCGNQANIINLMFDSDPKAVKYFNMSPQPAVKQEIKWVKNETAPYKVGQMGGNIKSMQEKLGVKPDGYFGKLTEKAVMTFNPQYKRETGVDQTTFEKIMGGSGKKIEQQNIVTQKEVNPNTAQQNLLQTGKNFGNKMDQLVNQTTLTPQQIAFNKSLKTR